MRVKEIWGCHPRGEEPARFVVWGRSAAAYEFAEAGRPQTTNLADGVDALVQADSMAVLEFQFATAI